MNLTPKQTREIKRKALESLARYELLPRLKENERKGRVSIRIRLQDFNIQSLKGQDLHRKIMSLCKSFELNFEKLYQEHIAKETECYIAQDPLLILLKQYEFYGSVFVSNDSYEKLESMFGAHTVKEDERGKYVHSSIKRTGGRKL